MTFEPIIGLEIHVQVATRSKMFCGCPAEIFGKEPNLATCPVCLGLPGALPVPNRVALEKTVILAKALGCRLAQESWFERKNYFYPDLPKGFQISQYAAPVGVKGEFAGVAIWRVHLEEDTGRLLHEGPATLIDFNRSGIPLIEIVTEPVFHDPAIVTKFLKELRTLLVHLEISDADMEKGSLRLEANISLRQAGSKGLPKYKVELKNINSFAFLEKALRSEIVRQEGLIRRGERVGQETRGFDEKTGQTLLQRRKEEAFDYRYFPEPDLPPLTTEVLTSEKEVHVPEEVRAAYQKQGVPSQYIEVLIGDRELAAVFEDLVPEIPPAEAANILVNQRFGDPKKIGAKGILETYRSQKKREFLGEEDLTEAARNVLADQPAAVVDYRAGKESALEFLLGQLMREAKGKIKPSEGREVLKKILNART